MPIMTLHYRNFNPTGSPSTNDDLYAKQKLRMSSLSVPLQKLTLIGYSVNLRKHPTLAGGASHKIPHHILVEVDELTTQHINNISPPKSHNGDNFTQTHAIPLPISDGLTTIQMGMNGLDFFVNKRLSRELTIHIKKFDETTNEIVSMTTSTNDTGQIAIDHLILYFSYSFIGNF